MNKTINICNEEINYFIEIDDTKPYVLFIHGFGDSLNIMRSIERIPNRDFNIVALDMPGCGKSSWNTRPLTLEHYFEVAKTFIKEVLTDKELYIVGHSLGCLSTLYCLKHTHAKYGLLVAPAHYVLTKARKEFGLKFLIPKTTEDAIESYLLLSHKYQEQMKRSANMYATSVVDKDQTRYKKFGWMIENQILNLDYTYNNYFNLFAGVDNYKIVSGDKDYFTNIYEISLVAYQQNKELTILKGAGHAAFLDSGQEIYEQIVKMTKEH
ncbi:alpha/beta fold hydrolase [Mycoplasma sp. 128]